MKALAMPKSTESEKAERRAMLQDATRYAIEVPLKVMKRTFDSFDLIKDMAEKGNPNSVSDAGVGALCARSAVMGAFLNVKINAAGLENKDYVQTVLQQASGIAANATRQEEEILRIVDAKINKN
jgi:glutamate formiminotransferase/formiminotetrahydrofolate cyclodeaminase